MKGKKFIAIISIVCIFAVMLCIPAFATVTESSGDGYALYNGEILPVLPEWNETIYPYAALQVFQGRYQFIVSTLPIYATVRDGSEYYYAPTDAVGDDWVLYEDTDVWEEGLLPGPGVWYNAPIIWANFDMQYDDGTLYLNASDPISLDGMTVVQWDGDTSGLPDLSAMGEDSLYIADSTFLDLSEDDPYYLRFTYDDGNSLSYELYGNIGQIDDLDYTRQSIADGVYWSRNEDALTYLLSGDVPSYNLTGTAFFSSTVPNLGHSYTSLFAYRTIEEPPDEGGDTPDEPQPPFGAAEIYLKLHPFLLTPQQK